MDYQKNVINSTGYSLDLYDIKKAKGMTLYHSNGKKYLDFDSGVWCLSLGHSSSPVQKALIKQLKKMSHVGYRYSTPVIEKAAEQLLRISHIQEGQCVFLSSGSEAVEYAIQLAQKINPGKKGLRIKGYYLSAYGYGSMSNKDWVEIHLDQMSIDQLEFDSIGYFLFEPGNYSGMVKLPGRHFVNQIVEKINSHQGLILVDEVTTGFGRTGQWFGYQNYNLKPDIIACGKGMGNGYPISAVICSSSKPIMKKVSEFRYAQSHQNDPLGAQVLLSVIDTIEKKNLLLHAQFMGTYFISQLQRLKSTCQVIKEVRGIGLMIAVSFNELLSEDQVLSIQNQLLERGFIVATIPIRKMMRLYPPLVIKKEQIDLLIEHLTMILNQ